MPRGGGVRKKKVDSHLQVLFLKYCRRLHKGPRTTVVEQVSNAGAHLACTESMVNEADTRFYSTCSCMSCKREVAKVKWFTLSSCMKLRVPFCEDCFARVGEQKNAV